MKILLVNPNATASMTDKIAASVRRVVGPGAEIVTRTGEGSPASLEGRYDEAMSVPTLLPLRPPGRARARTDTASGSRPRARGWTTIFSSLRFTFYKDQPYVPNVPIPHGHRVPLHLACRRRIALPGRRFRSRD
ncbi:aspartate/glutamate racemase family protein [Paracoccus actinidiae]|uniref:aspartate/glutamate racemase family protein n=1 Tax=Paracoccus actinidiae TaxID=3064531 RepID=UPI0027D31490|nr:aspartate/glutamate racemase family protein [Paracoccus sp. M09]